MANEKKNGRQRDPSLHKDHRQRMKSNFRETGLNGFQDHNILEMLLFYAIPRVDTNEIAHRLINTFGSLHNVFDADISELQKVDGVGIEAATLIKFFPEVFKAYEMSRNSDKEPILDSKSAIRALEGFFTAANEEIFVALFLDGRGVPRRNMVISQHMNDEVGIDLSIILKIAVIEGSKAIVVGHNHTNGFAIASSNDIDFTKKLSQRCAQLDIALCDHVIFSKNEHYCLSDYKHLKKGTLLFESKKTVQN